MTGAIISSLYYNINEDRFHRMCVTGSFFFIDPDVAVTTWTNLCDERNKDPREMLHTEDYLFFDSKVRHFETDEKYGDGYQCILIEREWLKESKEKNITYIHLPQPVTHRFYEVSSEQARLKQWVVTEGFEYHHHLNMVNDIAYDFSVLPVKEARKIQFFRQAGVIEAIADNDCIYTDLLQLENIRTLRTSCHNVPSMVGGPLLSREDGKVLGVISDLSDDSEDHYEGLIAVPLTN